MRNLLLQGDLRSRIQRLGTGAIGLFGATARDIAHIVISLLTGGTHRVGRTNGLLTGKAWIRDNHGSSNHAR